MARDITNGGGPWTFENEAALAPGDHFLLDFRNMEYKGTKGFFKAWTPLDVAQIINNDGSNHLNVTYNGQYNGTVVPNAVETYDRQGITRIRIENGGGTTIAAGEVKVEVKKEPYGADEAARERQNNHPAVNVLNDVIPGGVF